MFTHATRSHRYLRFARRLRYRTLQQVIGKAVTVRSEASVITDVVEGLGDLLPKGLSSVCQPAPGIPTVAKYALLDLEFALPASDEGRLQRPSVTELRELGLLSGGPTERSDLSSGEETDRCLDQFLEEIETMRPLLKIILDAADDRRSPRQRIIDTQRGSLRGYLPAVFNVRDCCITNAPSIWLARHFYMRARRPACARM